MRVLSLAPLLSIGCSITGSSSAVELGNTGRLAIAGDCIVVAEHASLVCAPRSGGGAPRTMLTTPDRTYVAIASDGDSVVATSTSAGQVFVDRVALDGSVTPIANAPATAGAGELALGKGTIFVSTGSQILVVNTDPPKIAGAWITATNPPLGAIAWRGTTMYWVDGTTLMTWNTSVDTMPQVGATVVGGALAADTDAVVVGDHLSDSNYSFVTNLITREVSELHGTLTRVATAGGHPYAIVDAGIVDATMTDVTEPLVAVPDAYDLAVDDKDIYWITRQGTLDRVARP